MNPLRWQREHQIAGIVICSIGGIMGTLYAWFDSRLYLLSKSLGVGLLFRWLSDVSLYWPWTLTGILLAGLTFYAAMLLRKQSP